MSDRSVYLRDQANKCERHARVITDDQTKEALRKVAAEYAMQAAEIESKENAGDTSPELSLLPTEKKRHDQHRDDG